jgi:tetratricopeptide (TPR) repeat protein
MADSTRKISTTFTKYKNRVSPRELLLLSTKLKENPGNLDLMDWVAFAYYSNGEMEQAIGYYQRLVAAAPGNASYHYYLGNALHKQGNLEAARNHWSKVMILDATGGFAERANRKLVNLGKK